MQVIFGHFLGHCVTTVLCCRPFVRPCEHHHQYDDLSWVVIARRVGYDGRANWFGERSLQGGSQCPKVAKMQNGIYAIDARCKAAVVGFDGEEDISNGHLKPWVNQYLIELKSELLNTWNNLAITIRRCKLYIDVTTALQFFLLDDLRGFVGNDVENSKHHTGRPGGLFFRSFFTGMSNSSACFSHCTNLLE